MCAVLAAPSPVVKVWPRDAPDALIYEATNGMFASCEDLVLGGHCHREDVRDTVCAVSCAKQEANDEANNHHRARLLKDDSSWKGKNADGTACCKPGHCQKDMCDHCVNTRYGLHCPSDPVCWMHECKRPPPSPPPPRPPPSPPPPSPPPPPPQPPQSCHRAEQIQTTSVVASDEASGYCWVKIDSPCVDREYIPHGVWFLDDDHGGRLHDKATRKTCSNQYRGWNNFCKANVEYKLADRFETPIGEWGCNSPPGFCHYTDGAEWVYDEDGFDAEEWNRKCGAVFWPTQGSMLPIQEKADTNSLRGPIDWEALELGVTSCNGALCLEPKDSKPTLRASCEDRCTHTGKYGGNGCSFDLDRYSVQLVYLAQLRSSTLLSDGGLSRNSTQRAEVGRQLLMVKHALERVYAITSIRPGALTSPTSSTTLLNAHISALDTMAKIPMQLGAAGYVPSYSRNYYENVVRGYASTFQRLVSALRENVREGTLLNRFVQQDAIEEAKLDQAQSVTVFSLDQTAETMKNAIEGIVVAQKGLESESRVMDAKAGKLSDELEKYKHKELVKMAMTLAFAVADFAGENFADIGKVLTSAAKSATSLAKISKGIESFLSSVDSIGRVTKVLAKTRKIAEIIGRSTQAMQKLSAKMPPKLVNLAKSLSGQIQSWGFDHSDLHLDEDNAEDKLADLARQLNELLPSLGTGAWEEYVADTSSAMNKFLEGYGGGVSGAARDYLGHLKAQSYYGNDFVTEGARFVGAVQHYLNLRAQSAASNITRSAITTVYKVTDDLKEYDMLQNGIMAVRMTTLMLQLQVNTHGLCQSLRYQMTEDYDRCVGPEQANKLNDLCGPFEFGKVSFVPFYRKPCQSTIGLSRAAEEYLGQFESLYSNVEAVVSYADEQVWGVPFAAQDSPFVSLDIAPWSPAPCQSYTAEPKFVLSWCDAAAQTTDYLEILPNSECLIDGATAPEGIVCCRLKQWRTVCDSDQSPPNRPYFELPAFESFKNDTHEGWGKIRFSLEPKHLVQLAEYDSIFVRGMAVHLEGAGINEADAVNLNARLTPVGNMLTRILRRDWLEDESCKAAYEQNANEQCMYENVTFWAGPAGRHSTVAYTSYYHDPTYEQGDIRGSCEGSAPRPVFTADRALDGLYQCTNLDLGSLEAGNVRAMHRSLSTPFNFASIFTTYELSITNRFTEAGVPVDVRSRGIDLTKVKSVRLGLWLKTNGRNTRRRVACEDIGEGSILPKEKREETAEDTQSDTNMEIQ